MVAHHATHMNDVSKDEAEALLLYPQTCVDIGDWLPCRNQPTAFMCEGGILDSEGSRSPLTVQMTFRRSRSTNTTTHILTVFKRNSWGVQRVYQLDIQGFARRPKNLHDLPHEHFGRERMSGEAPWAEWGFHEMLRHFTLRTRIRFDPDPNAPEHFELKG